MQLKPSDIKKIKNQFAANLKAVDRIRQRLEIIDNENKALMQLISETKPDTTSLFDVKMQKALAKRESLIKTI